MPAIAGATAAAMTGVRPTMITVHHLENSRSHRVLWLLEELDLRYDLVRHARHPETLLAPAALRAIHPLGKAPVLVEDGVVMAESGAIIDYLLQRHDLARRFSPPPGSSDWLAYRYWLHYAEGSLMPPLVMTLVLSRMARAPMPFFARPVARALVGGTMKRFVGPQLKRHLDFLDGDLAPRRGSAGDEFTAADVQMGYPLEAAMSRARDGQERPHVQAFLQRIRARPAYRQALAVGGPAVPPG
jgi:glutathione S-transferase